MLLSNKLCRLRHQICFCIYIFSPGKNNADADRLSRLVTPSPILKDSIKTICQTITIKMTLVETMSVSPDVLESQGTGIDMSLQMHNDLDWVDSF
jgi:hypothetical protein